MPVHADPLDLNINISAEERRNRTLSVEHIQLGILLLHARGYVVLKGAVPESVVTELRSSFKTIYDESVQRLHTPPGQTRLLGEGEDSSSVFWERNSRFRIFPKLKGPFANPYVVRNPFAEPIIADTLGAAYYCKFVSSDTCVNGAVKQAPHRDIEFYDGGTVRGLFVNVPITDCGLHNGPTEVWPGGSHLWHSEKFFKFNLFPFVQDEVNAAVEAFASHLPSKKIELRLGDLLIRDPGMWHRGTPNPTNEPRTMLTSGYFRKDSYFEYGDPFYNLDEDLYKDLAPSVQELFAPFFDMSDWRYWKLRERRAMRSVMDRHYLGAPLRVGLRWAYRFRNRKKSDGQISEKSSKNR